MARAPTPGQDVTAGPITSLSLSIADLRPRGMPSTRGPEPAGLRPDLSGAGPAVAQPPEGLIGEIAWPCGEAPI
jgi:hypothetical protein